MRYVSTRGTAPELGFTDVLLAGLATDGGLYVPVEWPTLPAAAVGATYAQRAAQIIQLFVGDDLAPATVQRLCDEAYATFAHPEVVPLVKWRDGDYVQELFHGPTLAFKDIALQLVGRMFDEVLRTRGQRVTVVGATSGDTGSAQGCLMSLEIGVRYPHRLAGIVGISGWPEEPEKLAVAQSPWAKEQKFLITHGTYDPLIPIAGAKAAYAKLRTAGLAIEWHEFPKEHTIFGELELRVIREFVTKAAGR